MSVSLNGWFTIPSGRPFLDDLALGLHAHLGDYLSHATVLTPTRRGTRAMAKAFGKLTHDGALLLPQLRAIGDLDEGEPPFDMEALGLDLPPSISHVKRRFELTKLILAHFDQNLSVNAALQFADSLAGFFDSLALEEINAEDRLERLVAGEGEDSFTLGAWAEHWQASASFLNLAVTAWPKRLEALGLMDPSQRQVALIRRLVNQWADNPPKNPTIVAGSTGSAPSMADLMKVVSDAPMGAVVLPGLDLSLADEAWDLIEESHPQNTLKQLISRHGISRSAVKIWPQSQIADRRAQARRRLLNEALRPAEATKDWRAEIEILRHEAQDHDPIALGLEGLSLLTASDDEQAASIISLLMIEGLQDQNKTIALITPDQTLSRRVSAHLSRFGLEADSSAGTPLGFSQVGRFLLEGLKLWQKPHDAVSLLAFLRHPMCVYQDKALIDRLEKILRGAAPRHTEDITHGITEDEPLVALMDTILRAQTMQKDLMGAPLSQWVRDFVIWAESLAQDSGQILWAGAAGAQSANLLSELMREGDGLMIDEVSLFCDIVTDALRQAKVRTGGNTNPRLMILGAIEARLVEADRVILAGLEEGVWPQSPPLDPFLSRPLRQKLGLPSPERRTGLSAHDFVQAASHPEVFFVIRRRSESNPMVPSRWIWRLETLARGDDKKEIPIYGPIMSWVERLNSALTPVSAHLMPAQKPMPTPDVSWRPMRLSVTQVETLMRDPYAIYAKEVLKLKRLDRPNEPFEVRERGNVIHKAIERFDIETTHPLGEEGVSVMTGLLNEEYAKSKLSEADLALRRPLVETMSRQFMSWEEGRRHARPRIFSEQKGSIRFDHPRGDFELVAKADRIEITDDGIDIIDFKTGAPPTPKQVLSGFNPQLTLTAAIIAGGGFDHLGFVKKPIGDLIYVKVASDKTEEKVIKTKDDQRPNNERADEALERLKRTLARFEDKSHPYRSWIAPQYRKDYGGDYDHLARLYEWHVLGDRLDAESDAEASS